MKQLKQFINWLSYEYNSLVNYLSLKVWIRRANMLHKETGYQFHVVPFTQNKLMIVSKAYAVKDVCISLKSFNKAIKGKGKCVDHIDILKIAYYSTPMKGLNR